jgi:hypothetical protein
MIWPAFVQSAWNHDAGELRNFMGYGRNWPEAVGSEDSGGRTICSPLIQIMPQPTR